MFGFVIGTLCLIALIVVLKREHLKRVGGGGPTWRGCGRFGRWGYARGGLRGGRIGQGQNPFLRSLFIKLDTTPGQEKALRATLDGFFRQVHQAQRSLWSARGQLATVFRSESLDEGALAEVIARHDDSVEAIRRAAVDGLTTIYQTLDERQREQLAAWLEAGAPRPPKDGPYRSNPAAV